jgi:hypothetical protein
MFAHVHRTAGGCGHDLVLEQLLILQLLLHGFAKQSKVFDPEGGM